MLRPRGELGELVDAQPARTPAEQRQRVERPVTRLLPDREDRAHRVPDRDAARVRDRREPGQRGSVAQMRGHVLDHEGVDVGDELRRVLGRVVDAAARADAEMIDGHHDEAPRGHVLGEAVVPERSAAPRCASTRVRSRRRGSRTAPPANRRDRESRRSQSARSPSEHVDHDHLAARGSAVDDVDLDGLPQHLGHDGLGFSRSSVAELSFTSPATSRPSRWPVIVAIFSGSASGCQPSTSLVPVRSCTGRSRSTSTCRL